MDREESPASPCEAIVSHLNQCPSELLSAATHPGVFSQDIFSDHQDAIDKTSQWLDELARLANECTTLLNKPKKGSGLDTLLLSVIFPYLKPFFGEARLRYSSLEMFLFHEGSELALSLNTHIRPLAYGYGSWRASKTRFQNPFDQPAEFETLGDSLKAIADEWRESFANAPADPGAGLVRHDRRVAWEPFGKKRDGYLRKAGRLVLEAIDDLSLFDWANRDKRRRYHILTYLSKPDHVVAGLMEECTPDGLEKLIKEISPVITELASVDAIQGDIQLKIEPQPKNPVLLQEFIEVAEEIRIRIEENSPGQWWENLESLSQRLSLIYEKIDGKKYGEDYPPFEIVTVYENEDLATRSSYYEMFINKNAKASCAMVWADCEVGRGGSEGFWFTDREGVTKNFDTDSKKACQILGWWIRHMQRRLDRLKQDDVNGVNRTGNTSTSEHIATNIIKVRPGNHGSVVIDPSNRSLAAEDSLETTIDQLDIETPALNKDNKEWAKAVDLKKHGETASTNSLSEQRSRGQKTEDGKFGKCEVGRFWRKDGNRIWYFVPSLRK